jgi:hypothetical protein
VKGGVKTFSFSVLDRLPTDTRTILNTEMKSTVRLRLHQAAMRSRDIAAMRLRPRRDRRDKESIRRQAARPDQLKRRIAATIIAHERGWSPQRLATHFGWSIDDTVRWLDAGKPLL